jgi:hypothetical protein
VWLKFADFGNLQESPGIFPGDFLYIFYWKWKCLPAPRGDSQGAAGRNLVPTTVSRQGGVYRLPMGYLMYVKRRLPMSTKKNITVTDAEVEAAVGGPIRDRNASVSVRHRLYLDKLRKSREEQQDDEPDGKCGEDGDGAAQQPED